MKMKRLPQIKEVSVESDNEVIEMEREEELEESGELTTGEKEETKIVKYSVTMAQIAKLKKEYNEVPKDLSVKKNYELVKKAASHIRGLRGEVEKRRKELKADALEWGRKVDSTAKEITTALIEIEEPFATAKKDHDTAIELAKREAVLKEEKRVDAIAERIATIKALVEKNISATSAAIMLDIEGISQDDLVAEWAMEFADKAGEVINETLVKLNELHAMKVQQETFAVQQAEDEAKRIRDEEEARVKREAELEAERAKIAAEREAMEAERVRLEGLAKAAEKAAEELAAIQKAKDAEREALAEAEWKRLGEEQAAHWAKIAAEKAETDRIQKEKDDAAEAERTRMAAEIEALKAGKEVKADNLVVQEAPTTQAGDNQTVQEVPAGTHASSPITPHPEEYRAAGNAMLKFIGNKTVTRVLLDAIINNEVSNIKFIGEAQ